MGDVTPRAAAPEPSGLALARRTTGRRATRWAAYGGALVVVLAAVGWFSTHPAALPTSEKPVEATAPVGEPVFVGAFDPPAGFDRTLHVNGVRVFADATVATEVVPHVCRGGSLSVTTDPLSFCSSVDPTEGATLGPGDAIVLEVTGSAAGLVHVDRVRVAYRDGVQWAVQDAGAPVQVTFLGR
jgi:hypothetical protein